MNQDSIQYYEKNATNFFKNTVSIEFSKNQDKFLKYLKPGMTILDFGCGSGRDTKYFIDRKYFVEAIDGSEEMCKLSSKHTGIVTKQMLFEDISVIDKYHGVWACASILHLSYENLKNVFIKIAKSLKVQGVFYTSFKYSDFEGVRNERYFTDMTEQKMSKLLKETNLFEIEEQWITSDVRQGRDEEQWFNIIMRKK